MIYKNFEKLSRDISAVAMRTWDMGNKRGNIVKAEENLLTNKKI